MQLNEIVNYIVKRKNIDPDTVLKAIKRKVEELGGLIEEEAAALIVAKELGVEIPRQPQFTKTSLKIGDLVNGLRKLSIHARIIAITPPRKYRSSKGEGVVARLTLADETGRIELVLWNNQADVLKEPWVIPGAPVKITGCYVRKYRDRLRLYLSDDGAIKPAEEEGLPAIEELAPRETTGETITLKIENVFKSQAYVKSFQASRPVACIRGVNEAGEKIRIIAWGASADSLSQLQPGTTATFTCLQPGNRPGEYRATRYTAALVRASQPSSPASPTDVDRLEPRETVDLSGYLAFLEPRGRYGACLIITGLARSVRVEAPSVNRLAPLLNALDGQPKIQLWDITLSEDKYRLNPWSQIDVYPGQPLHRLPAVRAATVKEAAGMVELRAAITRLWIKTAFYTPKKTQLIYELDTLDEEAVAIASLRATLDDGTETLEAVTNSPHVLESLLGLSMEDLRELGSQKAISEMAEAAKQDVLGREYVFKAAVTQDPLTGSRRAVILDCAKPDYEKEKQLLIEQLSSAEH